MQAAALEGERILVVEDEPLIALEVRDICEREGATVLHAPTIPEALRLADYPAVSAGVLDLRVRGEDADPVCEALGSRRVPFIFFTGMSQLPRNRWPAIPVVQKPAPSRAIVGALKFVMSASPFRRGTASSDILRAFMR